MKLKRIELQGFKSFVDRTVLEFDAGITAILGPNGCGKSNVVDAVRWVLGEQSAKNLRGGKMDDVIFKGTTKRKPVGMAEVTLTFINDEGRLPVEYEEVAIKRRVTRDGTSDYFLNGTACRLKDLRDLLWDTGVNNTSYSIIEESMIKQILNENNQELRRLLEEGSGITKYKARRKETQRKLDRTTQDLLRLDDIVEEIGREVRSLQRQVGKARRHQRLFAEIRALDLSLARRRREALDRREAEIGDQVAELRTTAEADTGELNELRARIETQRPLIDEREAERRQLEEALQAFDEQLQENEREVAVLEQRVTEHGRRAEESQHAAEEADVRRQQLEAQIATLDRRHAELANEAEGGKDLLAGQAEELRVLEAALAADRARHDEAVQLNLQFIEDDAEGQGRLRELKIKRENRQERLLLLDDEDAELAAETERSAVRRQAAQAQREDLTARRRELLEHLAATERRITDLELAAEAKQQEQAATGGKREAAAGRLELLTRLQEDHEGYGKGARHVLTHHGERAEVLGGLADRLQVQDGWAGPFETLLGEMLDAVVVDGAGTATELVQELRRERQGQAVFLCPSAPTPVAAGPAPAGGRPAHDALDGDLDRLPHLARLLARTYLFETDDLALAAALSAGGGELPVVCLSRSGLVVTSDGLVRGGAGERGEISMLGRGEKLDQLRAEVQTLDERLAALGQQLERLRAEREEHQGLLRQGREDLEALNRDLQQVHMELAQLDDRERLAGERRQEMGAERVRLQEGVDLLAREEDELRASLAESGRRREDSTVERDELRRRVQASEARRDELRYAYEELRLLQQRRDGERRETETALSHMRANVTELQSRRERLLEQVTLSRQECERLGVRLEECRQTLVGAFQERERRRHIVRNAAEAIQALRQETEAWHDRIKAIEEQRTGCRDRIHQLETELATLDLRRNNLEERVEEQYSGTFKALVASVSADDLPRELELEEGVFQEKQAEALLEDRREKLNGLGPINHLALEEYETKKERFDFLEAQRADVVKAKGDLEKAIGEINRTARKLFATTFEEVRRNYIAVFQTLFKGGRADLQLLRTDDPLESNILITAQPTGKVIDHVSLLSGGERCLTALSILFAVYLVKPSPFCLLDEADAPLDDTNIGRFVTMLREFSRNTQFLVITHNKLTMETANHLYGVTMMERGCSSIVSVSFQDVAESQSDQDLAASIASARQSIDAREAERKVEAEGEEFAFGGDGGGADLDDADSAPAMATDLAADAFGDDDGLDDDFADDTEALDSLSEDPDLIAAEGDDSLEARE
ncbi:MAG: chromosome segregation protein SMC [Candidatus Krumholzibacteriia bacterium]